MIRDAQVRESRVGAGVLVLLQRTVTGGDRRRLEMVCVCAQPILKLLSWGNI
jgi:hypothetical protein